jgi:phosphohistidine phosphatase
MRHAKAANESPNGDDHTRPLNARGRDAALEMGRQCKQFQPGPEAIFSSDAARTKETVERLQEGYGTPISAEFTHELYLASPDQLLGFIQQIPDNISAAMVVGHNPGMHLISYDLCAAEDTAPYQGLLEKFPTAALAVIRFDANSWLDVDRGRGTLIDYLRPEEL